ncbi:TetR/AcrR family transcriptional regulator [Peribacillus sp. B-H-3]|uniref:TetR/AcrR family transcriptional regulator n=1 Tax=Peribacillus sp. B-H-3 TaxID=3400420 RepID=UPI003B01567E
MPKVSDDYKEKKREHLLESALKCFGEKGYQAATMDDIVVYSKTSKGLIYNYFKSKEELYISLMEERTSKSFQQLIERFTSISSAKEKIQVLFRIYKERPQTTEWRNLISVHMEFWINSAKQDNLREIMKNRYKEQYRLFMAKIIEEGKMKGEFKKEVSSEAAGSLFWAMIDGICLHYSVVAEDYAYREHFEAAEDMYMNYLLL